MILGTRLDAAAKTHILRCRKVYELYLWGHRWRNQTGIKAVRSLCVIVERLKNVLLEISKF